MLEKLETICEFIMRNFLVIIFLFTLPLPYLMGHNLAWNEVLFCSHASWIAVALAALLVIESKRK